MKITERNQVIVPGKSEAGESWTDLPRRVHPQNKLQMPVGEDACGPNDGASTRIVPIGQSDVTDHVTGAIAKGYSRIPMTPYEDQYSGEHADPFYDTVEVDGKEGFVERANYLDRI